jgi:hypothetical protein
VQWLGEKFSSKSVWFLSFRLEPSRIDFTEESFNGRLHVIIKVAGRPDLFDLSAPELVALW